MAAAPTGAWESDSGGAVHERVGALLSARVASHDSLSSMKAKHASRRKRERSVVSTRCSSHARFCCSGAISCERLCCLRAKAAPEVPCQEDRTVAATGDEPRRREVARVRRR